MYNTGNLDKASKFIANGIKLSKEEEDYKNLTSFMSTKTGIYHHSGV